MGDTSSQIITEKEQLVNWIADGICDKQALAIGTEHEKFLFRRSDLRRPAYEDTTDDSAGIGTLLETLAEANSFSRIMEGETVIGLKDNDGGSISLEPGGQLELSGAPLATLHETCQEANRHLKYTRDATTRLDMGMLGLGFDPLWGKEDITWMPKGRYKVMREYMPRVGKLGLDMMKRTCTIQVNLDYVSEVDMVRKFRTSLALQPLATALFANSPFRDGKPSGLVSTRAETWTDTDSDRCGVPVCVFEDGFGFERWVDYILDVPMYFLHRGDGYVDVAGQSFRDFMAGKLPGRAGELPTMMDWEDHITTAFPEVRLKTFLEMRGADGGSWGMICALPALWVGLLYDDEALTAAEQLAQGLGAADVDAARMEVAKNGLKGHIGGRPILDMARRMVEIASEGLRRRGRLDTSGSDETGFLDPIRHIAESGETLADAHLKRYATDWQGNLEPLYREFEY